MLFSRCWMKLKIEHIKRGKGREGGREKGRGGTGERGREREWGRGEGREGLHKEIVSKVWWQRSRDDPWPTYVAIPITIVCRLFWYSIPTFFSSGGANWETYMWMEWWHWPMGSVSPRLHSPIEMDPLWCWRWMSIPPMGEEMKRWLNCLLLRQRRRR